MSIRGLRRPGLPSLALCGVLVVAVTGCQATGMGWIASNVPTDKATFGFKFDDTTNSLSGSYHDPQGTLPTGVANVAFKGVGVMRKCAQNNLTCAKLLPGTKGGCLIGSPEYQSQNPALRGGGHVELVVCDSTDPFTGEVTDTDFVSVDIPDGPYAGYHNQGEPHGNITVSG